MFHRSYVDDFTLPLPEWWALTLIYVSHNRGVLNLYLPELSMQELYMFWEDFPGEMLTPLVSVHLSGQIIATSHDLTSNGGLVRVGEIL